MATKSRQGSRAQATTPTADVLPWPGKRSGTHRARAGRDGVTPWPGKRTRAAGLRRPPPMIDEPAELDAAAGADHEVSAGEREPTQE